VFRIRQCCGGTVTFRYGSGSAPLSNGSGLKQHLHQFSKTKSSVGDPDPQDPHVFGPPGSGSISQKYGSGSGSGSTESKSCDSCSTTLCRTLMCTGRPWVPCSELTTNKNTITVYARQSVLLIIIKKYIWPGGGATGFAGELFVAAPALTRIWVARSVSLPAQPHIFLTVSLVQ
jgi:hypothetical protein